MRHCPAFGICGLLLIFTTSAAWGQTPEPLLASCAWVRAENDGAGAGFVIDTDRKLLVTCRHLVAERTKVDVIFPWYREGELVADRREYLGKRLQLRELGLLVTGTVIKTSDELDLALVQLESLPKGVRSVVLATNPASSGERIRVIGNRIDLDTVWNLTTGPVRATGKLSEGYFWRGKKLAENAAAIIAQLPTEEGDSGGPAFNDSGELVGMASALRRQCPLAAVAISSEEIGKFAAIPGQARKKEESPRTSEVVEELMRATVWVRPTATDVNLAGVLIDANLVLTCGRAFTPGDIAGVGFPIREENHWV
ncbi:MAG TPA: serine protease, partial [Gemmata sp.]|nr:serine protease [Gemmata sp.]